MKFFRYNAKTYRAVVIAFLQAWIGWAWHLPGRLRNVYRFHTEPKVDPAEFKARVDASIARMKAAAEARQRQASAEAKRAGGGTA